MCDCEKVLAHLDELNVNYDEAVAHDKEIVALKQSLQNALHLRLPLSGFA